MIVGAGGHGQVVKEIVEVTKRYEFIDFVDDKNSEVVGKVQDLSILREKYGAALVSIGNNQLRGRILEELKRLDYEVPVMIHPSAYISKSCRIGDGTIVEPMAVINANSVIAEGCIISPGAIVDHDVTMGNYVHINSGAVVKAGSRVESYTKVDAGTVYGN